MKTNLSRKPRKTREQTKERVCLTIDEKLYKQFREVSDKWNQPSKSAIVENAIHRYVQSKI